MHPMAILCAHFTVATYLRTLTQWDNYVSMACDCDMAVRNMDVSVRNEDISVRCGCQCQE